MSNTEKIRILVVDDEQDILDSYKKILTPELSLQGEKRLNELENMLFDRQNEVTPEANIEICFCQQGADAIEAVKQSLIKEQPFALAFIDVRMPPGLDGIMTAEQIRALDPFINIVIVTAFSDISPEEIGNRVSPPERLLYVQKPFHAHEISQFAAALSAKWQAEKELIGQNEKLDILVKEKTSELSLAVEALERSNLQYKKANDNLQKAERELEKKANDLSGANIALQQLTKQNEIDRKELEEKVLFAVHEMVAPFLNTLENSKLDEAQSSLLKIIKLNLEEITAPFMKGLSSKYFRLSPTEIQIANFIKQDLSTKEICEELNMTKRNVDFHRDRIREKIGIKNTKANLKNVLKEMEVEFIS